MRTTIYIPDDEVKSVKEAAWKARRSVSLYFMDLHRGVYAVRVSGAAYSVAEDIKEDGLGYDSNPDWGA